MIDFDEKLQKDLTITRIIKLLHVTEAIFKQNFDYDEEMWEKKKPGLYSSAVNNHDILEYLDLERTN